jgi:hypothetical protein
MYFFKDMIFTGEGIIHGGAYLEPGGNGQAMIYVSTPHDTDRTGIIPVLLL